MHDDLVIFEIFRKEEHLIFFSLNYILNPLMLTAAKSRQTILMISFMLKHN